MDENALHHPGLAGFRLPGYETDPEPPALAPSPEPDPRVEHRAEMERIIAARRARVRPTDPVHLGPWRRQHAERLRGEQ